jgi:hypothetical protein
MLRLKPVVRHFELAEFTEPAGHGYQPDSGDARFRLIQEAVQDFGDR